MSFMLFFAFTLTFFKNIHGCEIRALDISDTKL